MYFVEREWLCETEHVEHKKHYLLKSEHPLKNDLHLSVEIGQICKKNRILYSFELGRRLSGDFLVWKLRYCYSGWQTDITGYKNNFDLARKT